MKAIIQQFAGAAMVISFMFCYLPQIIKILKTKKATDVSPLMILLGVSGYTFGLIYMFSTAYGLWWFLNYTTGLISSAVLFYCWNKYK